MAIDLSQRRIDAVGHNDEGVHIIEITTVAGLRAIGQLEAYPRLYARRFHPMKPIQTHLVCSSVGTDLESVMADLPFQVHEFPDKA